MAGVGVTLTIRAESLAKFGGTPDAKLYRVFIKFDGSDEEIELHRTADCPRHYVARDHQTHYCLSDENTIHKLPSPPQCSWMCNEVCPYKKRRMQDEIDLHGQYYSEEIKESVQDYLAKEDTIDWTIKSEIDGLDPSAQTWTYSK